MSDMDKLKQHNNRWSIKGRSLLCALIVSTLLLGSASAGGSLAGVTGLGVAYANGPTVEDTGGALLPLESSASSTLPSTTLNVTTEEKTSGTDQQSAETGTVITEGEQIRVALFANLGSRSPGNTDQVTLTSSSELTFESRSSSGKVNLGITKSRFSLDQYQVKVYESKDLAAAQAVLNRVKALGDGAMKQFTRRGATFYAVYAGLYSSSSAADTGMAKLTSDSTLTGLTKGYTYKITGPHYLQAGTYASLDEAKNVLKQLLDIDVDAYVVTMPADGKLVQAVWVGQAASDGELNQVKTIINKQAGSISVGAVQAESGLIHTMEYSEGATLPHYGVYGSSKWVVSSTTTLQVSERYNRSYRGVMEVGVHNDKLSVVNELPLEQYLVSVVGAEMSPSWPIEALKAQSVAARTFALYQNGKFEIANVVDTTLSQAYYGIEKEDPRVKQAVEETAGLVLIQDGKLIESIFSSNAGGITADPSEVWGGSYGWSQVVDSPDDVLQAGKLNWHYVQLPSGKVGYVREDVVTKSAKKNSAGFELAYAADNQTNVRPIPAIQSTVEPVAVVDKETPLVILSTVPESTNYAWVRGPYTGAEIADLLKSKTNTEFSGSATKLEVTDRGPSGRVTKMEVNGVEVSVSSPDSFRSAFGGLPSTLFDVESSSSYSVIGADGKVSEMNGVSGKSAIGAGTSATALQDGTVVLNGNGEARVLTAEPSFTFTGKGYGHGVGMSQWGAKGLADQGYDYKQILQYYYKNVELLKR